MGGVPAHELGRELLEVLQRYAVARERAYPRVGAVDEIPTLEHPVYHFPCPPDALQRRRRDLDPRSAPGDAHDVFDGEVVARERDRTASQGQESQGLPPSSGSILLPCPGLPQRPVPD